MMDDALITALVVFGVAGLFAALRYRPGNAYGRLVGRIEPWLFLGTQVAMIHAFELASIKALATVIGLLSAYALAIRFAGPNRAFARSLATIAFAGYCLYWILEKYLMPFIAHEAALILAAPGSMSGAEVNLAPSDTGIVGACLAMVGISYIGFKLVHFHIDQRAGAIRDFRIAEFLNWMLFFPSIIAGPMMRFQDWQAQRGRRGIGAADFVEGVRRIMAGVVLKYAIADSIQAATLPNMDLPSLTQEPPARLAMAAAIYTAYLYFDFSGYSHMAIGLGRFFGLRLPENFRFPFLARNIADYWNRWHISLSTILRDYLFYPISLAMKRNRALRRLPALCVLVPPVATFTIAGLWHGLAPGFILYGLWHGVGLGVFALIRQRRSRSRLALSWEKSWIGHAVGTLLTFVFVTIGLVFFSLTAERLLILWHRLWPL